LQYEFIFSFEDIDSGIGNTILNYTNSISKIPSSLKQDHNTKSMSCVTTDKNVRDRMFLLGADFKYNGIPKTIWTGNRDFVNGFIDGLFSSDGCIENYGHLSSCRIVLVSAYKNLVCDVQKLLSFFGIRSNIKYSNQNGYDRYDLVIYGKFAQKFGKIFSLSNKSKSKKLNDILKLGDEGVNKKQYRNERDYLIVKKVEATDFREDVYDITVYDDTHTFLTECGITGNCSELPLAVLDSCRLMFLNLYSYVDSPFTAVAKFNFELFFEHVKIAQRLMDDLVDLELEKIETIINKIKKDPESDDVKREEYELWVKIKNKCSLGRRTGLGVTAVADMLAALGYKYGSNESVAFVERILKKQKLAAFRSSMEMAKELGAFPIWDFKMEKDSEFLAQIKKEDEDLFNGLKKNGRRNIGLLTIAPVGTLSIQTQTSSGIEPVFNIQPYTRRKKIVSGDQNAKVDFIDDSGDKWQEFEVMHPKLKIWMEVTGEKDWKKSPWYGCCSNDIDWKQRVKLQAAAQRHIDHSISSTINLPSDISEAKVSEIYETAWEQGCKGITVYREGCRSGVMINKRADEVITKTTAPKRPKELPAQIFAIDYKKEKLYVAVGLLNNEVYEVFTGINFRHKIDNAKGKNIKRARGKYSFLAEDGSEYELTNGHTDENADALTRVISAGLRHGCDVGFLVHQLEKTTGDLTSFAKVLARVLKKFIKDGTIIKGEACPSCNKDSLRRESGCVVCVNCGFSKCG